MLKLQKMPTHTVGPQGKKKTDENIYKSFRRKKGQQRRCGEVTGVSEGGWWRIKRRNDSDLFLEWTVALTGFSPGGRRGGKLLK